MGDPYLAVAGRQLLESAFIGALRRREPDATSLLIKQMRQDRIKDDGSDLGLVLLSKAFRGMILSYLNRHWFQSDPESAQEAWNDTLARVYSQIGAYDPTKSTFLTWVFNQARYAALDIRRALRRNAKGMAAQVIVERGAAHEEMESPLSVTETNALQRAWRRLGERERKLLHLRYVQGYGNVEIARNHFSGDLPEEYVRVYVGRAVRRLKKWYEEELGRR